MYVCVCGHTYITDFHGLFSFVVYSVNSMNTFCNK